jgi:hypothetical protein
MLKPNRVLKTPYEIHAAIDNNIPVVVFQKHSIVEYGVLIESQTEITVTIEEGKYIKATCEIRVR